MKNKQTIMAVVAGVVVLVGVFAQMTSTTIAEHIREEHLGIIVRRLEQHDISIRILMPVALHAGSHARVGGCRDSLRKFGRRPDVGPVEPVFWRTSLSGT